MYLVISWRAREKEREREVDVTTDIHTFPEALGSFTLASFHRID